ncbi:hypothetical protein J3A83DRAFT_3697133 [Scleroderma citrinum]
MAPLNLQGLNVVHTSQGSAQADLQDSLASPFGPDFSAHLDLWTNLTFDTTDDPLVHQRIRRKSSDDHDDDNASPPPLDLPTHNSQDNAVQPTQADSNSPALPFDINTLLTTFGVNPFLVQPTPPSPPHHQQQQQSVPPPLPLPLTNMPSLAQLFALHTAQGGSPNIPPPPPPVIPAQPLTSASASPAPSAASTSTSQPTAKRARTHKAASPSDTSDLSAAQDPASPGPTAAEDKRRRNTAASARFRLKKKEREAALERRAKELEDRVMELERECEGLRRENGWLKGLVVGVTGAGAGAAQQQPQK